jgi:hypothetical protein
MICSAAGYMLVNTIWDIAPHWLVIVLGASVVLLVAGVLAEWYFERGP